MITALVFVVAAAATTVVLLTKRDAGSYAQPPTCADITKEVSDLPPLESEQATFKVDLRYPALVREPQGSVESEWLCQTEVRLLWLDFYLLARKA